MAGGVVTLEQAKSGRSTCRASGEPIAKGEWRVGFETWISGRVAMAWMGSDSSSDSEAGEAAVEKEEQGQEEQEEDEQEPQQEQKKAAPQQQGGGLTEMERQRLELIKRNRERMMALNLPGMAAELLPAAPAKQQQPAKHKGVSRKRLSEVLPRRESSRLRGIAADGSMIHAERQGEITVVAGEVIRRYASGAMAEEQEPQDRHPQGEVQFESSNASAHSDEAFIQLLARSAAAANSGSQGSDAGSSPGSQPGSKAGGKRKGARGGGSGGGSSSGAAAAAGALGAADLCKLRLAEDDVAKVTKEATTHLAFHPTTDTLIVACADKKGNVSLWHVNEGSYELPPAACRTEPILRRAAASEEQREQQQAEGEGGEDVQVCKPAATSAAAVSLDASAGKAARPGSRASSGSGTGSEEQQEAGPFDGVLLLQPQHYQYVSGLRWAGGSGRGAALFTASYDGSLRRLDVEQGVSDLVVSAEEDEYSCMDVMGDGRTALLGDNVGQLRVVDVRAPPAGSLGPALDIHAKKINTVHFEPTQEQVFATASTDTTIKLWDMRALSSSKGGAPKPLATGGHPQACQAALFAPDGSRRLVSTSFDNTCRIWDGANGMQQLLAVKHDNQTGRWVLPFRACWNAAGDGVIVGNMNRFVDIFDAGSGALAGQLSSPFMTAIPSRNAVHPRLPVLAAATNSGRIHIYR
ncbi:hypothetical protein COHA_002559 [Chlorella ohadii]|uniref:PARP-type domain-containing protein n=1 Tax=Chlorella ohadii TaxID=2649997 RepID=A0AAD5DU17_9CHLO|nr:hypothetical protein COHA_002559 [Chlorella ohadii]